MDAQLKRGLLDVSVLAVLRKSESYGYKIVKDISPYIEMSESTLYPVLKRLEAGGFVDVYSIEHNGRLRRYYRLNDPGRNKILEFLNEWKDIMQIYNFINGEMNYE